MIPPGSRETVTPERVLAAFRREAGPSVPLTAPEVAEAADCARRTAHAKLARLAERGDLRTKKVGARGRVYWLPEPTESDAAGATEATGAGGDGDDASRPTRAARVDDVALAVAGATAGARSAAAVEAAACNRLVDPGPYRYAVSGAVPSADEPFVPRAWAAETRDGDGGADTDAPPPPVDRALVERATRTGTVRAVRDVRTDSDAPADGRDVGSYAAIPLVDGRRNADGEGRHGDGDDHGDGGSGDDDRDDVVGVAVVYAADPGAFEEAERAGLAALGGLLGTAIRAAAATERLLSERAVDCTFRSRALGRAFADEGVDGDATATVDDVVALDDGDHLQYWTVVGTPPGPYARALARLASVRDVRLSSTVDRVSKLELHTGPGSLAAAFDAFDGRPSRARLVDDGAGPALVVVGRFPARVDGAAVADAARASGPDVDYVSRRPVATSDLLGTAARDCLTERQWRTVRLAFHAGYFERPRRTTGAALAARTGVSGTTFHRHLRAAEARLFAEVLDPSETPGRG